MHAFAFSSCYKKKIGKKGLLREGHCTAIAPGCIYISAAQCSVVSVQCSKSGSLVYRSSRNWLRLRCRNSECRSVGAASPSEGSRVAAVPVLCLIQPGLSRHSVWRGRGHQPAAGLCNVVLFQTCYTYHDVWHTQAVISYIHFDEERGVLISDSFRAKCHRKVMHVN